MKEVASSTPNNTFDFKGFMDWTHSLKEFKLYTREQWIRVTIINFNISETKNASLFKYKMFYNIFNVTEIKIYFFI